MVANAGIIRPARSDVCNNLSYLSPYENSSKSTVGTVDDWDQTMSVNARGVYLCYKYAAEAMIAQGRGGRIIGAASVASKQGMLYVLDNIMCSLWKLDRRGSCPIIFGFEVRCQRPYPECR